MAGNKTKAGGAASKRANKPDVNQGAQARYREKLRATGKTGIRINAEQSLKDRLDKVPGRNHEDRLRYLLDQTGY